MSIPLIQRLSVAIASCALASAPALAQSYPTKPIRIASPYASGQGPDLVARLFAERLSKAWNQQVIVEARPGANGFIAFLAPRNTPAEIVSVINREVNRILGESDFKERMDTFGFHPTPATPAELSELVRADLKRNALLIKQIGAKAE